MRLEKYLKEKIEVDISVGDIVLGGRFKNKRIKVKKIGRNEKGDITINGRPLLKYRILPKQPVEEAEEKSTKEKVDEIEKHLCSYVWKYEHPNNIEALKLYKKIKPGSFWKKIDNCVTKEHHPVNADKVMKFLRKHIK